MKRIFLAAASVSLLAIGAPSAASAHHAKRHAACSARTHRHHAKCARAHVLRFGSVAAAAGGGSTGTAGSSSSAPTTPSAETAGTVKSYNEAEGVLTITLTGGTEVSGKVTAGTELQCESATPPTAGGDDSGDDDGAGEGSSGGDSRIAGSARGSLGSTGPEGSGDAGDDSGDEGGEATSCTTAALVPGAVVREAELRVSSAGAVWEKVHLLV